jgi:hypothetical protein
MDWGTMGRKMGRSLKLFRYAQYTGLRAQGMSDLETVARVRNMIEVIMRQW